MKPNTISKALIVAMAALMFAGCNTKHTQEETNTTHTQNPVTQTTQEGVPSVQTDDGTASSNTSSGSSVQGSTNSVTGSSESGNDTVANDSHADTTGSNNNATTNTANHSAHENSNTTNTEDNATTGNSESNTTNNNDDNTTTPNTPALIKLTIESNTTTLNIGEKARLNLTATYSDNTAKPINKDITYLITPKDHADINGTLLSAHKDGNLTVQAKVGNMLSNTITLDIYWEVNGHRLPPEPDPKVNNATLLGVDVNKNGVRDDVERWIYTRYKEYIPCHQELDWNNTVVIDGKTIPSAVQVCEDHPVPYHPVVRAVAMQGARAAQIIIQHPEKARETTKIFDDAIDCEIAIKHLKKRVYQNREYPAITQISLKEGNGLISKLFNTVLRARAYAKYNYYLSGGVYEIPTDEDGLKVCDDKVKALLKDLP